MTIIALNQEIPPHIPVIRRILASKIGTILILVLTRISLLMKIFINLITYQEYYIDLIVIKNTS